jgi:peptide deformylase
MEEIKLVNRNEVENVDCEDVQSEEMKHILDVIIPQMKGILKAENGVGLAAPQVGIKKRFFIAWNPDKQDFEPYFNAFYIRASDSRTKMQEGCLSYEKGKYKEIKRYKSIKLIHDAWNGTKFERKTKTFRGIEAIILQHECDHLRGKTIFN